MKAGAVEFLPKPFNPDEMLGAIKSAIERSRTALAERSDLLVLQTRYSALSRRERQVLELVVRGQLNKQVGGELGISEITVKAHRGRMMRKMRATSLPDLVNIAARLRQATTGANQNP
jgi:FixJ family two-component response regulator